eukprot:TRINITY_DN8976_c0_g2_i7.p2 TRINITY_DN8976_c0_g2~~TRINITY_DN8976_c0_g2_i7.p2  ORF type:complete len:182 (+),score=65.23 TRINITY_DN8976_c0_g2_i7:49-546(+)
MCIRDRIYIAIARSRVRMSGKLQILRFVVEEQEDVIYSNTNLAPEDVQAVGQYIINHIKKKYNSEQLTMRDIENQHYELDEIIEFSVSPIFITIPKRAEIQTFTTIKDRDNRTIYKFVENDGVKIEKYRQTKKTEEVRLELHTICLLYTSPSPRDGLLSRMPSSA